MTVTHTDREIYEILFRYARNHRNTYKLSRAYTQVDYAVNSYFHNFEYANGIERVLRISRAVLWAMHWRHDEPRQDKKWWQSERHVGFELTETVSHHWFQPIKDRLPG